MSHPTKERLLDSLWAREVKGSIPDPASVKRLNDVNMLLDELAKLPRDQHKAIVREWRLTNG